MTPNDRQLAAEYALGVLDGRDLEDARRRVAADTDFRAEVGDWSAKLAPMIDEIDPVDAPAGLWRKIELAIGSELRQSANDNAADLQRQLGWWRAAAGGMTAIAAALGIVLLGRPDQGAPPSPPAPPIVSAGQPMVAMVGDSAATKVVANWDPAHRRLVLAVAGDMPADPRHSHELWVIPAGGTPRSLGTMPAGKMMHMDLADALADLLRQGSTIAISVEPKGGSPSGAPTGPVVASGTLERA